jgi:outer membrane immunogenic protein
MKKSLFAGIGILALAAVMQPAAAADMAVKAPVLKAPPLVEVWSWTGLYIGGNVGYSWGRSDTDASFYNNTTGVLLSTSASKFNLNGWVAGGQVGYNWQNGNWVFGLEADIQWTGQDGDAVFSCPTPALGGPCNTITGGPGLGVSPTASFSQSLDWFGTLRARLGVTVTPTLLAYVTGGLAYGQIATDGVLTGVTILGAPTSSAFSYDKTKAGWTAGGGLEGRISGNWTAKIEYLYLDFGTVSGGGTLLTSNVPLRAQFSSDVTDHILRVGLNYKFGNSIVARY